MIKQKTRNILRKLGLRLIAAALILTGLTLLTDLSLRPVVEKVNAYECHAAVTRVINEAVLSELDRVGADYSTLVCLTTNNDGEVISVESNVMNINRLKTNIADRVEREIERLSAIDIQIPIGTLMGIQLLHGRGFSVGMSVQPLGYATTAVISEFTQAGINQTRHRILIEISAAVDAIIPGYSTEVPVTTTIVAAETIIVGRVPEAYTHVVTESEELVGLLQDYGAGQ